MEQVFFGHIGLGQDGGGHCGGGGHGEQSRFGMRHCFEHGAAHGGGPHEEHFLFRGQGCEHGEPARLGGGHGEQDFFCWALGEPDLLGGGHGGCEHCFGGGQGEHFGPQGFGKGQCGEHLG